MNDSRWKEGERGSEEELWEDDGSGMEGVERAGGGRGKVEGEGRWSDGRQRVGSERVGERKGE